MVAYFVSFDNMFVRKFWRRHSIQRFYPWVSLFLGIFYVQCVQVSRKFVKQLDPPCCTFLGFTIDPFSGGAVEPGPAPFLDVRD